MSNRLVSAKLTINGITVSAKLTPTDLAKIQPKADPKPKASPRPKAASTKADPKGRHEKTASAKPNSQPMAGAIVLPNGSAVAGQPEGLYFGVKVNDGKARRAFNWMVLASGEIVFVG